MMIFDYGSGRVVVMKIMTLIMIMIVIIIIMISSPTFNDLKEKSTGSDKLRGSDLKKNNALD